MKLIQSFYDSDDTLKMAKDLIGHFLYTNLDGNITGGMIVETEAYMGVTDSSCHTFNNRKTNRNATMYCQGGVIYMYVCYGIHDMLNIVTGSEGDSQVILIRAIEPLTGIEIMKERRGDVPLKRLTKGPGSLAKALGLKRIHDGISLTEDKVWIEDQGFKVEPENIIETARIGLGCPEPYFSIPWRFFLKGNVFVSGKTK
ncbi:3-methyladenine DNA glycosylase [Pedobacter psychrophilus]|uniref:Putative 3-methyladenine DNA glycosylase n=1 Tax=Pedobacter psychrophilus TaxID=1826909 RepID=A0A179DCN0_9SPHI|nr:DNA-3-methyladenine glycosylase [Pedobacter psychrophilus]OAQ38223.1 3-methyladenine DNA glycosylase [Pedobacter psychrophilus]